MAYQYDLDIDEWHHPAAYPPATPDLPPPLPLYPRAPPPFQRQPASYHPYAHPRYQQQRSSPLSPHPHQPAYLVPDDFFDPSYGKMYTRSRQQSVYQPPFDQQRRHSAGFYDSSSSSSSPAVEQQPYLRPSHPQLQHLQHVQIPVYPPVGHGPRSASSSSSTSSHATSASASTSSSATSNASSYVPGPADMMASSGVMCVPDLNLGMGMGIEGMDVDMDMAVGVVDALDMDMGMAMGIGMAYIQQPSQRQQSAVVASNISPMVIQRQQQHHILYDDEHSPVDPYAEYGDQDSYASDHQQLQQQQLQALHLQHMQLQQMEVQQHLGGAEHPDHEAVAGVVQEWQKEGREYDSADSDSELDGEKQRAMVVGVVDDMPSSLVSMEHPSSPATNINNTAPATTHSGSESGSDSDSDESELEVDQDDTLSCPPLVQNGEQDFVASPITKRASTRTITSARSGGRGGGGTRARASTQTLTQRSVVISGSADVAGDVDADVDAEGEEDVGEGQEVQIMHKDADASGEEDEDESEESSFDYDDEKDGEFILRSRSRSLRSSARSSLRRVGEDGGASAKRLAGRSLRSRTAAHNGGLTARYNPYSIYAANATAAAGADGMVMGSPTTATTHSSVISSSMPGLRTLSASLAINTSVEFNDSPFNSPTSPTLSSYSSTHSQHSHATASSSSSSSSSVALLNEGRHRKPRPTTNLPVPVPVPNLTKKSRGRRVPTVSSLEELRKVAALSQDGPSNAAVAGRGSRKSRGGGGGAGTPGTKGARMYLCDVEGCGKCFARGEHLKRHVRSIHTNEKPHTCPYPGCGKDFSRHDNLGQHMRVHKDFVAPQSVKA